MWPNPQKSLMENFIFCKSKQAWLLFAKIKDKLKKQIKAFKGGCISSKIQEWKNITSNKEVLKTVEGLTS